MKGLLLTIGALAAASSLTVGLNSALAANHSAGAAVKVADAGSGLGRILVDGRGRTLYLFEKDKHGTSACTGQCAGYWPPLIVSGKPLATAGAKAALLGTTKRGDGRLQLTYNHHPLYTFVKDTSKGQTNGEELDAFGAEWYALSAAGAKVEKNNATSSGSGNAALSGYGPDTATSGSGTDPMPSGYGY
jgi:predicted lipoprotein with Yx(FWY)xxD motif